MAIYGIKKGNNALICAGTGSGKTLPAEYFINIGYKIIYTTPIKALSNQKYNDFKKKFPERTFGLITGDIKENPNAECVIMTCEILRNCLFMNTNNDLEINVFDKDLIVFDEVHYINDNNRGSVWEDSIIMTLNKTESRILMLSATLGNPNEFSEWVIKNDPLKRDLYLSMNNNRIVPLETHFLYIQKESDIKKIKDKNIKSLAIKYNNESIKIDLSSNECIKNVMNLSKDKNEYINSYTINNVIKFLRDKNLFPSIFFVLSKKDVMKYAKEVTDNLLDEKNNFIKHEIEKIIMKMPNYKEYMILDEYVTLVKLIEKGIGYHHSGMLSIFRELVELMFEKGYIKILFATETFSVGINLPTKAVVFSNLYKHDGDNYRCLYSHEYKQMSGRAGRRSIDNIGYSFILNIPNDNITLKNILNEKSTIIKSKYNINNFTICSIVKSAPSSIIDRKLLINYVTGYLSMSYMNVDNNKTKQTILKEMNDLQINKIYNNIFDNIDFYNNYLIRSKKYKNNLYNLYSNYLQKLDRYNYLKLELDSLDTYEDVINILSDKSLIDDFKLTTKGIILTNIQEIEDYNDKELFINEIMNNYFNDLSYTELYVKLYKYIEKNIDENIFMEWINIDNVDSCNKLLNNDNLYVGNFVKSILKLNNFSLEIIKSLKEIKLEDKIKIPLEYNLKELPKYTLKFVVTNQSLYI